MQQMLHAAAASDGFRAAATDIDRTLKGGDTISEENIGAVAQLKECGLIVMPATGRIYQQTMPFRMQARLNGPLVCSDGALVRFPSGKVIAKSTLGKDVAAEIREHARLHGVTTLTHLLGGVCVTTKAHWTKEIDRHRQELGDRLMFRRPAEIARLDTLKIICSAPQEQLDEMESWAKETFPTGYLSPFRHHGEMIDFRPAAVNKVTGLSAVADYYGFEPRQFMAFGDGSNDVEMLSWAGLGIAMFHGSEEAKASADVVAPSTSPSTDLAAGVDHVITTRWNQETRTWSLV